MGELTQLGKRNFTEKWSYGFLDIYEKVWEGLKDKPIRLLEMGVYNGNSLRTWISWFSQAEIIGIDKYGNQHGDLGRAKYHSGDQADAEFIKTLIDEYKTFDIIIDDAGHIWSEQQAALRLLWPSVSPGGMYIIEDLQTSDDDFYSKDVMEVDTVSYLFSLTRRLVVGESKFEIAHIDFYPKCVILIKQ